jgi:hypothetical protein
MYKRFTKGKNIVERKIRSEHILVPIMGSMKALDSIYSLDEVASFIWSRAVEGFAENEIVSRLTVDYEVDEPTAKADTRRVLEELERIGALEAQQS